MRIYDDESKRILSSVTLYLTPGEARELAGAAEDLAANPEHHHHHVSDETCQLEITVAVYTRTNLNQFDEESRKLLAPEFTDD